MGLEVRLTCADSVPVSVLTEQDRTVACFQSEANRCPEGPVEKSERSDLSGLEVQG